MRAQTRIWHFYFSTSTSPARPVGTCHAANAPLDPPGLRSTSTSPARPAGTCHAANAPLDPPGLRSTLTST